MLASAQYRSAVSAADVSASTNALDVALRALTNTAGSVDNSGSTFIQDAILDANGNITNWVSAAASGGGADYTNAMRGALNGYYMRYATPTSVYISSGSIDVGGSYVSKSTSDTLQLNTVLTTDNRWIWICVSNSSTDASTVYHLSTNSHSVAWSTNNAGLYLDSARVVNAILSTQSVTTIPRFENEGRYISLRATASAGRGYYFYLPVNWMFAKDQNPSGAWQAPDEIDSETVLAPFTKRIDVGFLSQDNNSETRVFFTDYDSSQGAGDLYGTADFWMWGYHKINFRASVDFDIGADLSIMATGEDNDDNEISYGWQGYEIWLKED
jgi:hypothetical protein